MTGLVDNLEATDRALLNLLQSGFPLDREPFRILGGQLGVSGADALRRARSLQEAGLVRSISGIFDPAGLGYKSTLAALHVEEDPDAIGAVAAVVNAHPGVSHNYARNHYFNLWFTLSLPADEKAEDVISDIAKRAGAGASVNLPAVRVFKLRVYFDMIGDGEPALGATASSTAFAGGERDDGITIDDKRVVKQLCQDLPLVEMPFDVLAERSGLAVDYFMARMRRLQEMGVMRRLSAVLRHRKAGFVANAMTCFKVPAEQMEAAGAKACDRKEVSHCYERRTAPGWPYNLFAMVHGRSQEECQAVAEAISRDIAIDEHLLLYSSKEYKKEKVRYFEWVV